MSRFLCLAITAVCASFFSQANVVNARPWVGSDGKTIVDAEFDSIIGDNVVLKEVGGRTWTLELKLLGTEDQQYARDAANAETALPVAKTTTSSVELMSISVAKPFRPDVKFSALPPIDPGTDFLFLVSCGDERIVGVNQAECSIDHCTDERGLSLIGNSKEASGEFDPVGVCTEGGRHIAVAAHVPRVPRSGATKITVEGVIAVRCGRGKRVVDQKAVPLRDGSEVTVGPIPLKIEVTNAADEPGSVFEFIGEEMADAFGGESNFTKYPVHVTFLSEEPQDGIRGIEFLDASGQLVDSQWLQLGAYDRTYGLRTRPEEITVRVHCYEELKTHKIPVKMETGLGL